MMQAGFRQHIAQLEPTDEKDVQDLSLWESWGTRGFKDVVDAVKKNDTVCCIFQPEVAIDTIKDIDKRGKRRPLYRKFKRNTKY